MSDVVVAGHLCIDLIPGMVHVTQQDMNIPGRLYTTEAMTIATGGAVSNTGLALHKLGVNTALMATVGDDLIGQAICAYLEQHSPALTNYIRKVKEQASSYTIVLSPQNADRTFLHCTGTNDTFGVESINFDEVKSAKIFHLGYPTLLPQLVHNNGAELALIFAQAKAMGAVTSLDMAMPDPNGDMARLAWHDILVRTLPFVDIFIPSIEEMLLLLRRDLFTTWTPHILEQIDRQLLSEMAEEILSYGVAVAGFKMGEKGMYLKTGSQASIERLADSRLKLDAKQWTNQELWQPAFKVNVAGTTGAGDSAYAGFLTSILHGYSPQMALQLACAVGACNVERPDATSGIQSWSETMARVVAGWPALKSDIPGF
jgi:sugar/nucleoside kinase (ribokinase family)